MMLDVGKPIPGWYRRRLVKGGPWLPVLICWRCPMDEDCQPLDRSPVLLAFVGGAEAEPYDTWTHCAGQPILELDYETMLAQHAWDRTYAPASPGANPRTPVDIRSLPPAW